MYSISSGNKLLYIMNECGSNVDFVFIFSFEVEYF